MVTIIKKLVTFKNTVQTSCMLCLGIRWSMVDVPLSDRNYRNEHKRHSSFNHANENTFSRRIITPWNKRFYLKYCQKQNRILIWIRSYYIFLCVSVFSRNQILWNHLKTIFHSLISFQPNQMDIVQPPASSPFFTLMTSS